MITPQLTEQYGHVERVSLARAILSVRSCANAGFKSNPKTAAAAPPMVVNFRKSRREGFMVGPPSAGGELGKGRLPRSLLNRTCQRACQEMFSNIRGPTCDHAGHFSAFSMPSQAAFPPSASRRA